MERRYFFKSIAGLFAAAALSPELLNVFADVPHPAVPLAVIEPRLDRSEIDSQFHKLTAYMHAELVGQLSGVRLDTLNAKQRKVGSAGFTQQCGIHIDLDTHTVWNCSDDDIRNRFVRPAITQLARTFIDCDGYCFGTLPLFVGGVDSAVNIAGANVALRGLRYLDLSEPFAPRYIHRFDILFR